MITYSGAQKLANWFAGKTYARNGLYIGLSTTTPTVAGANITEPSATTYSRVMIASAASNPGTQDNFFGSPVNGENGTVTIANNRTIYFPETWNVSTDVGEDWGVCTHACLFASGTKGTADCVAFVELPSAIHPGENNQSSIPIVRVGDIVLSFGNPAVS